MIKHLARSIINHIFSDYEKRRVFEIGIKTATKDVIKKIPWEDTQDYTNKVIGNLIDISDEEFRREILGKATTKLSDKLAEELYPQVYQLYRAEILNSVVSENAATLLSDKIKGQAEDYIRNFMNHSSDERYPISYNRQYYR